MQTDLEERYFVLKYAGDADSAGCPLLLKGELNHRGFEWETALPISSSFVPKKDYIFRAKHKVINFDFNADHHFIASERFCQLCESFGARITKVPLTLIQSTGIPTEKSYFYLLCQDWADAIDLPNSKVKLSQDLMSAEVLLSPLSPDRPEVEAIFSATPMKKEIAGRNFFRAKDMRGAFICSSKFKYAVEESNMLGCKFVPFEDYRDVPFWVTTEQ